MEILEPILYLIAFALFIYGLMGLTGPRTAVRGNWIAAVGMGIAMLTALIVVIVNGAHNIVLIIVGLVVGTLARRAGRASGQDDRRCRRWWRCSTASAAARSR